VNEPLLRGDFQAAALNSRMAWFNPPKRWRLDARGPGLVVEPDGQTDFWERMHSTHPRTLPARRRDLRNLTMAAKKFRFVPRRRSE
jgi:hypothetical protein